MSPHRRQGSFLDLNNSPTLSNRWQDQIIPDGSEWTPPICSKCHKAQGGAIHVCIPAPVAYSNKSK